ncbi:hypothetical protein MAR_023536 [Mya arenaria]|uniref:Uncharacterized protein n=1 Tax=Mya arenaria TaxID=6604 RepID=A0ABY7DSU4_MYAAR|nr:hypothetical protein MAR_023536 [Mya arenaria]
MKCVIFFVTVVALGTYSMELDPDFELELAHNMEEDSANFLCPAEIAIFDACNPREMTIALPRHPDPSITVRGPEVPVCVSTRADEASWHVQRAADMGRVRVRLCTLKTGVTGEIDLEKVMKGLMGRSDIILKNNDDTDSDIDMIAGTGGMTDLGDLGVGPIDDAADVDDKDDTDEDWTTTEPTTTSTTSTTTTTTASTTTPTTTTATTTTPKPTEKPCAGKTCPGVWKLVLLSNGNCQCVPPSFGGSRG